MREKQNSCLIISDWSENMPFLLQNSFFAILVVIRQKPVQKEELVKNAIFSLLTGRHWRINVNKSLITYKKQILTDFTNLRKSCDLASARSRSVSIPSGCRGNPESNEAIARITVASSSLHIKTKMHVISQVRAHCNQWQNCKEGVGRGSSIFPFLSWQNVRETLWGKLPQLSLLPIASHGIMHGSQGITGESMFTKGFAKTGGISEDIQRIFSNGN